MGGLTKTLENVGQEDVTANETNGIPAFSVRKVLHFLIPMGEWLLLFQPMEAGILHL